MSGPICGLADAAARSSPHRRGAAVCPGALGQLRAPPTRRPAALARAPRRADVSDRPAHPGRPGDGDPRRRRDSPPRSRPLRERLNLDQPLSSQFVLYLQGLATFDLGEQLPVRHPGRPPRSRPSCRTRPPSRSARSPSCILVAIPLGMTIGVLTRGGRRPVARDGLRRRRRPLRLVPRLRRGNAPRRRVRDRPQGCCPPAARQLRSAFVLPIAALALGPDLRRRARRAARDVRRAAAGLHPHRARPPDHRRAPVPAPRAAQPA